LVIRVAEPVVASWEVKLDLALAQALEGPELEREFLARQAVQARARAWGREGGLALAADQEAERGLV
jgi:hypothetical protein